jgi:hypothetical protein
MTNEDNFAGLKRKKSHEWERDVFSGLARNAFEFLNQSLEEFDKSLKLSVIHFAIAVELFLKAKLMSEHWSLILERPDQADKAAFQIGNLKTVSLAQAVERLRKVASINITNETKGTFDKISNHRNKMVHFAHKDIDAAEGRVLIGKEQSAGWLALRLLLNQWEEFEEYENDIARIHWQMERHRAYLQHVYEVNASDLGAHEKAGLQVKDCPRCNFKALKLDRPHGAVALSKCVVCRYGGCEVTLTCPNEDCHSEIVFSSYDGIPKECPECTQEIDQNELRDQLDTGEGVNKDNYFDHVNINCPQCSGYHSVVEHNDIYVCTQCLETDNTYGICGYCSEGQLGGVSEFSALSGCEFCDGAYKDD